jgi:translation initiation factor IF-2
MNTFAAVIDVPPFANVEAILAVLVVVFWIVSWLIKLASTQNQKGPPVANRPRPQAKPRDDRLQDEIDIFLQEVSPQKPATRRPPPPPRPQPAATRPAPRPVASASAPPARRPPVAAPAAPKPAPKPERRARPGQEIAGRSAPITQNLGAGVKQHLTQYMADKVSQDVSAHMQHRVEAHVTEHLGTASPAQGGAQPAPAAAIPRGPQLAEWLRNPGNMRQAIVLGVILSPPPSRQPRSGRNVL